MGTPSLKCQLRSFCQFLERPYGQNLECQYKKNGKTDIVAVVLVVAVGRSDSLLTRFSFPFPSLYFWSLASSLLPLLFCLFSFASCAQNRFVPYLAIRIPWNVCVGEVRGCCTPVHVIAPFVCGCWKEAFVPKSFESCRGTGIVSTVWHCPAITFVERVPFHMQTRLLTPKN